MNQENIDVLIMFVIFIIFGIIVARTIVLYLIRANKYGGMKWFLTS